MKTFLRYNGLSLVMFGLFLLFLVPQHNNAFGKPGAVTFRDEIVARDTAPR